MEFLENLLENGRMAQTEIAQLADEQGIKRKTLQNAKEALSVKSIKVQNQWYWEL